MKQHSGKKHNVCKWVFLVIFLAAFACLLKAYQYFIPARQLYRAKVTPESMTQKVSAIENETNYTALDQLPKIYTEALLSAEDKRFYVHPGFDILATARAAYNDVRLGRFAEGGSTITQQLAKNMFFTQEKALTRKIAEVMAAFTLENKYSKDKILELYINSIYYGNGYYGIYDAAMGYFGKTPAEMTDAECLLLVGIPNAPSAYAPTANPQLTLEREQQVLQKMIDNGKLTESEANDMLASSQECLAAA